MFLLWLASSALAASGDGLDSALVEAVAGAYGKAVPRQAICTTIPRLPAGVEANVTVVGVTQRLAGCRLLGMWVDDTWRTPEEAAKTVLGEAVSAEALEDWTRYVLLAFDQLDFAKPVKASSTGSGWKVAATFHQRRDTRGGSLYTEGSFTFDSEGALVASDRDGGKAWTTRLRQSAYRVDGVDESVVFAAVKSRGKTLQKCFDDAWSSDLTLEGPARIQWTIAGGKASALGILTGDDGHPGLVSCYGAAIRTMAFPEGATGSVVWSFLADRRAD